MFRIKRTKKTKNLRLLSLCICVGLCNRRPVQWWLLACRILSMPMVHASPCWLVLWVCVCVWDAVSGDRKRGGVSEGCWLLEKSELATSDFGVPVSFVNGKKQKHKQRWMAMVFVASPSGSYGGVLRSEEEAFLMTGSLGLVAEGRRWRSYVGEEGGDGGNVIANGCSFSWVPPFFVLFFRFLGSQH